MPAFAISYFHRVGLAAVGDGLQTDLQIGAAALGLLSSLYFYIYAVMQIPAGALADTVGPRRTIAASLAVTAVGTLIFAVSPTYAIAAIGRLLVGLGVAAIFTCILKIQAEWFPPRLFGTLSGLLVTMGNFSGLLAYTPTAAATALLGWRTTFAVIAALTLVILGATWLIVRDRPADLGLAAPEGAAPPGREIKLGAALRSIAGNWRTWPAFMAGFAVYGSIITLAGAWAVPYLRDVYEFDRMEATSLAQLTLLGLAIGAPITGWISDRLRARRLPYVVLVLCLGLVTAWLAFGQPPKEWIGALLFTAGLSASAFALTWAAAKEVNPPEYAGLSVGLANAGGFVGVAVLQPLVGIILDRVGTGPSGYQTAFQALFWACILSLGAAALLTETRARNIWSELRAQQPHTPDSFPLK
ncbi:MAG: MFS transporter [Bacillota bacterium]